jgi:hypothetical protein
MIASNAFAYCFCFDLANPSPSFSSAFYSATSSSVIGKLIFRSPMRQM